jgi:hypothetical protein
LKVAFYSVDCCELLLLQATKAQWPHLLFWETPAEHPKDQNLTTCREMRGAYLQFQGSTRNNSYIKASQQSATVVNNFKHSTARLASECVIYAWQQQS